MHNLQITISVELYSNEQIVLSIYNHNTPPISFYLNFNTSRSFHIQVYLKMFILYNFMVLF
jgi:hypothetical protein